MAQVDRQPPDWTRVPSCEVIAGPGTAKETIIDKPLPLTGRVLRVRTTKTLSSPAGTFQLQLTAEPPTGYARPLHRILVPGNTVEIRLDAGLADSTMETVMLGWVTSVEQAVTLDAKGRPQRSVMVSGQDMGKFFLQHDLPGYLLTGYIQGDKEMSARLDAGLFISGLVGDVLRKLFLAIFETLTPVPLKVLEEGQLLTDPVLDGYGDDALLSYLSVDSIWSAHGKFWNTFRQYVDAPWNEAFGDYIPDPKASAYGSFSLAKPKQEGATLGADGGAGYYLVVRRHPFDEKRWADLPTTRLYDDEIKMERLRLSDDERTNMVVVMPLGRGTRTMGDDYFEGAVFRSLYWDKDSTQRHGTQSLQTSSVYTDIGSGHVDPKAMADFAAGTGDIATAVRARARLLWGWYSINHLLRKGMLIVAGNPSIRIGERVAHAGGSFHPSNDFLAGEDEAQAMYVEQVSQDFAEGSHYLTHLAVTRVQPRDQFQAADFDGAEIWQSQP